MLKVSEHLFIRTYTSMDHPFVVPCTHGGILRGHFIGVGGGGVGVVPEIPELGIV